MKTFKPIFAFGIMIVIMMMSMTCVSAEDNPGVTINETGVTYNTIQDAINAASAQQTVVITNTSFFAENLTINVTGLTITSNSTPFATIWSSSPSFLSTNVLPCAGVTCKVLILVNATNVTLSNLNVFYNGTALTRNDLIGINKNYTTILNLNMTVTDKIYDIMQNSANSSLIKNNFFDSGPDVSLNSAGIRIGNTTNMTLINNTFVQGMYGFTSSANDYFIYSDIINNTFIDQRSTGSAAIYLSPVFAPMGYYNIINNSVYGSTKSYYRGFYIISNNGFGKNNIINNTFRNITTSNGAAIHLVFTNNDTISHNRIFNGGYYAIKIDYTFQNQSITHISNNYINGSSVGIFLRCNESFITNNTYISNNTFTNNVNDVYIDYDTPVTSNPNPYVYSINNSLNVSKITIGSGGTLFNQYRLNITVIGTNGTAVSNATITINDFVGADGMVDNPTAVNTIITDNDGNASIPLTEFKANKTYNKTSGYLYFSNYTVMAQSSGYSKSISFVNMTQDRLVAFTLSLALGWVDYTYQNSPALVSKIQQAFSNLGQWIPTIALLTIVTAVISFVYLYFKKDY